MVTDELYHQARTHYGKDPALKALNDVITSFYSTLSDKYQTQEQLIEPA
jgi:hypothetical protein